LAPLGHLDLKRAYDVNVIAQPVNRRVPTSDELGMAVEESDRPVLNRARLFEYFSGMEDVLHETIKDLLDSLPAMMLKVHTAHLRGEISSLAAATHELKGVMLNFHAERVSATSLEIEKLCHRGEVEKLHPLLLRLEREVRQLVPELQRILSKKNVV
jgi:HPt (histidine-containing phosphotransfer) domain-containing protein